MHFLRKQLKARLGQTGREKKKADNLGVERRSLYGFVDLTPFNALKKVEKSNFDIEDIKYK